MIPSGLYNLQATRLYFNRFWRFLHIPNALDRCAYEQFVSVGTLLQARNVFELGPGTGMLARHLFTSSKELESLYLVELSDVLCCQLARQFSAAGSAVTIKHVIDPPPFDCASGAFDRFISCFVLDCMDIETQRKYVEEAHRLLNVGGLFCTMSVTSGATPISKVFMWLGNLLSLAIPKLALGIRFVELENSLRPGMWRILENSTIESMGFATRLLIARKQ